MKEEATGDKVDLAADEVLEVEEDILMVLCVVSQSSGFVVAGKKGLLRFP